MLQSIISTNGGLVYWPINASLSLVVYQYCSEKFIVISVICDNYYSSFHVIMKNVQTDVRTTNRRSVIHSIRFFNTKQGNTLLDIDIFATI